MNKSYLRIFFQCSLSVLCFSFLSGNAQNMNGKRGGIGIIQKDSNKIIDIHYTLYPFYNKLYQLSRRSVQQGHETGKPPYVVPVMHIGDSHIQAGFFSVTIMNLLQEKFGSAGRGLVFPLKLARTNEPFDYLIRSQSKWDKTLCVQSTQKLPVGLGGLSIKTNDQHFSFEIKSSIGEKVDHSFNKITVFHHEKAPELRVVEPDVRSYKEESNYPFASVVYLDKKVNQLHLYPDSVAKIDSAIYYGFNLENGNSGILYHSVGINGAQFRHYASVQDFAQQISILVPELFIFSLGTNEAFRGALIEKRFFAEIDRIIAPIRQINPKAVILITTPPDCLAANADHARSSNPNIAAVRQSLIDYAKKNNYAFWDLYSVLGGDNSAYKLYEAGYLSKDGVHFKKDGYDVLGHLFFDALLNNYTDYVQHRL